MYVAYWKSTLLLLSGIELFPTSVRGTAMAVTLIAARLGAILGSLAFAYLVDVNCAIPLVLIAALLGGNIILFLLLKG